MNQLNNFEKLGVERLDRWGKNSFCTSMRTCDAIPIPTKKLGMAACMPENQVLQEAKAGVPGHSAHQHDCRINTRPRLKVIRQRVVEEDIQGFFWLLHECSGAYLHIHMFIQHTHINTHTHHKDTHTCTQTHSQTHTPHTQTHISMHKHTHIHKYTLKHIKKKDSNVQMLFPLDSRTEKKFSLLREHKFHTTSV